MAWLPAVGGGLIALILAPGVSFYFDVTPKLVVLLGGRGGCVAVAARHAEKPAAGCSPRLAAVSLAVSAASARIPALSVWGRTWRRYGVMAQSAVLCSPGR